MQFFKKLFGAREPAVEPPAPARNFDEWQHVTVLIPMGEDEDPESEYQPWLEFGQELGEAVSNSGLGDYVGEEQDDEDNMLMFECKDAVALATFLKQRLVEQEDLPKGSRIELSWKAAGIEKIHEETWELD